MAEQLEDDVQRVLELARAQQLTCRPRGKKLTATNGQIGAHSRRVQRHRHGSESAQTTLVAERMKSLRAIYALDKSTRHLADCSAVSVRRHQISQPSETGVEDPEFAQQQLDRRRELYKLHYSGSGLVGATCATTGLPKLESLVDAAEQAAKTASRSLALRVGAAVLTSRGRIWTGCNVESTSNDKYSICAEHAALLKMVTSGSDFNEGSSFDEVEVVEALAICSDRKDQALPYPCGGCREYMARFGDFPVYLLNFGGQTEETRSFNLFPGSRHSDIMQISKQSSSTTCSSKGPTPVKSAIVKRHSSSEGAGAPPLNIADWTVEQVAQWIVDDVELPQYRDVLLRNKVDGCVLMHLEDADVHLLLGIVHPLHRKRLLAHIDRVRDRELLLHGIDYGQLQDYLAVLDRDRIAIVAKLKATFDRLDKNKDGVLDFAQAHEALKTLGSGLSSPQAVEQLFRNESLFGEGAKSGAVTFPMFATAFSKLAMKPATEGTCAGLAGRENQEEDNGQRWKLPIIDLASLRGSFNKVDSNQSGDIDANELIRLFKSLGHEDNIAAKKAHEWFKSVDLDGNGRLSFSEFVVRYLQLTKVDIRKLQTLFEASEPLSSTRLKPRSVLCRSLKALYSDLPPQSIDGWTENYFKSNDKSIGTESESLILSYADFVLGCFTFNTDVADMEQTMMTKEMKMVLRNDALVHRSRIVHLQQQGHVRLCSQSFEVQELRRQHVEDHKQRLDTIRKKHQERQNQPNRTVTERDGKCANSDEERSAESIKERRQHEVAEVFDRFARGKRAGREHQAEESKDSDNETNMHNSRTITAIEAAQAILELGAALSREQILRFLKARDFDLRNPLNRRDFQRVIAHLDAEQQILGKSQGDWKFDIKKIKTTDKHISTKHKANASRPRSCEEYDKHLLEKAKAKSKNAINLDKKQLNRRPSWSREAKRSARKHRHRSKQLDYDDESKGNSSSDSSANNRRRVRNGKRIHRRDSSDSSQDTDSTNSGRSHQRRTRRNTRSRSASRRGERRGVIRRGSSSSSDETRSTKSSRTRSSSDEAEIGIMRRSGFQEGDRVRHKSTGAIGSVIRVYRDYFVADVLYDSGRRTKNVDLSSLQLAPSLHAQQLAQWKRGLAVLFPHKRGLKSGQALRRGKIVKCRTDGTFDILVDEFGECETISRVPMSLLRVARRKQHPYYGVGAKVTVRQRAEYLRGTVSLARTDGSYDIHLRGGSRVLKKIAPELLSLDDDDDYDEDERNEHQDMSEKREKNQQSDEDDKDRTSKRRNSSDSDDERPKKATTTKKDDDSDKYDDFEPEFDKGDRIEARFHGGEMYFPGRIARVFTDDTYDVTYDDGDEESRVPSRFIRSAKSKSGSSTTKTAAKTSKADDYEEDLFESD